MGDPSMDAMNAPNEPNATPVGDTSDVPRFARDAWLRQRVLDHIDTQMAGAYTWDPTRYAPVGIHQDGEATVVFAKT